MADHHVPLAMAPGDGADTLADEVYRLLREGYFDDVSRVAETLIRERIADGDSELVCVHLLLQYYATKIRFQSSLDEIDATPLKPDQRLYACFDQVIDLLRHQERQISTLQAMIAELL